MKKSMLNIFPRKLFLILFCSLIGDGFSSEESSTAHLFQARSGLAAASVKDLFFFGGGFPYTAPSPQVDIYNATSGQWNTARLSQGLTGLAAASVNNLVLFGGGYNYTGYSDRVDIYNATSGNWTTASLSQARNGLAAASVNNLVLFGGGLNATGASDRVDVYNATSGQWNTARLSQGRNGMAAASVKDMVLFAAGSYDHTSLSDQVDIYNATSGVWTTASLSIARDSLAAASIKDLVLFGGGLNDTGPSDRVDIYNATSGQWNTASLSQARSQLAAVSVNNLVLFGGGYNYTSLVDIYNATSGEWNTASLSQARSQLAAASVNNLVLFGGGYNYTGPSDRVDIWTFADTTGTTGSMVCAGCDEQSEVSKSNTSLIIALVVGIVGGVALISGIVVFWYRRRNLAKPVLDEVVGLEPTGEQTLQGTLLTLFIMLSILALSVSCVFTDSDSFAEFVLSKPNHVEVFKLYALDTDIRFAKRVKAQLEKSKCLLALISKDTLKSKEFTQVILTAVSQNVKVILVHDESSCKFPAYSEMPQELLNAHVFDNIAVSLQPQLGKETWESIIQRTLGSAPPVPKSIDVFLSHRQITGQGIAMALRLELNKLDPKLQIFLDVKAEFELHNLPLIVEKSKLFVFILTEGIFASEYCLKELETAVQLKKKIFVVRDAKYAVPEKLDNKWAPYDDYFQDYYEHFMVYTAKHSEKCAQEIFKAQLR
jgi:kelch-like protein 20